MTEPRDKRRAFTKTQQADILYQQGNKCAICHKILDPRAIDFDHIKPWAASGKTIIRNGAALCPTCHRIKTHKSLVKKIDNTKTRRKLASKQKLNQLTIKQLKYLEKKHRITPAYTITSDIWGNTTKTTSKRQHINCLFGEVYEGEKTAD